MVLEGPNSTKDHRNCFAGMGCFAGYWRSVDVPRPRSRAMGPKLQRGKTTPSTMAPRQTAAGTLLDATRDNGKLIAAITETGGAEPSPDAVCQIELQEMRFGGPQ